MELLVRLGAHTGTENKLPAQNFAAILHSGYPEPIHCSVALDICRQFAMETGRTWLGGLSRGASSVIGGQPLASCGFMTRKLCVALELAATALAKGHSIPTEAVALAAKVPIPSWLFVPVGNFLMWKNARKQKTRDLHARPFSPTA